MRTPVFVETQIAVTLYYLCDEGRLRKVANVLGFSRACCSVIVQRVPSAITTHLGPLYIKLPTNEDSVKKKSVDFSRLFLFHSVWAPLMDSH